MTAGTLQNPPPTATRDPMHDNRSQLHVSLARIFKPHPPRRTIFQPLAFSPTLLLESQSNERQCRICAIFLLHYPQLYVESSLSCKLQPHLVKFGVCVCFLRGFASRFFHLHTYILSYFPSPDRSINPLLSCLPHFPSTRRATSIRRLSVGL